MKAEYQITDRKDSRALAQFLSGEGQALLPMLELIEQDLDESPFYGEGHRKVHHRLRCKICVGRNRVLRGTRENHLLSPSRVHQGQLHEHQSSDAPPFRPSTLGDPPALPGWQPQFDSSGKTS